MSIHGKIYLTLLVLGATCLSVAMASSPDHEDFHLSPVFTVSGYGFFLCILAAIITTIHHIWSL